MTDADLDTAYTAICDALAHVGPERAQLFLSMLCLALMARYERAGDVLALVDNVRAQCDAEAGGGE
jgi:hypothetical protein